MRVEGEASMSRGEARLPRAREYYCVRIFAQDLRERSLVYRERTRAECAFAEELVRADRSAHGLQAVRRVELLYGGVLLDVAYCGDVRLRPRR